MRFHNKSITLEKGDGPGKMSQFNYDNIPNRKFNFKNRVLTSLKLFP